MVVQSVLIPYSMSQRQAYDWLDRHGFVRYKVDEKQNFRRFRQYDPRPDETYRTRVLPNGIRLIVKVDG